MVILRDSLVESGEFIGEGSFGKVYGGKYAGTPVVIKTLKNVLDLASFRKEANLLDGMSHPNIVSILAFDRRRIILERYDSDASHLTDDDDVITVARDCMRALTYMHLHMGCIRHGDIKPENILLKISNGIVTKAALGDMGLARSCSENKRVGTRGFMPFIKDSADRMHDIFALAVSLLDATFNERVHAAKENYDSVADYPPVGTSHDSLDNTMYYANQMAFRIKSPLAQMLVLVYRPGHTEEEKNLLTRSILDQWEALKEPHAVSLTPPSIDYPPRIDSMSEDNDVVNPATMMMMGTSESGIPGPIEPGSIEPLDDVRDSDFNF